MEERWDETARRTQPWWRWLLCSGTKKSKFFQTAAESPILYS